MTLNVPAAKPWTPHPYQLEAVRFLLANAHSGLLLDPGLGKTTIVLAALTVLKQQRAFRRALVVAPKRVALHVWPGEKQKWLDFWSLQMHVLHGAKKDTFLQHLPDPSTDNPDICVVTFDGLEWLARDGGRRFLKLQADLLIVDESTYIRHTNTRRFKSLKPYLYSFGRRHILTGTPIPRSYEDLFGQIFVLDRGGSLGKYITAYRNTYFDNVGYDFPDWRLREGSADLINAKIRPLVLRGDKDDYLMLPTLLKNDIEVELPAAVRTIYGELEKQFYACLESGEEISSPTAAALGNKLRQVANGFVYQSEEDSGNDQRAALALHDEKIEALKDLVASLQGKPALVFYEYVADAARICTALNGDVAVMGKGNDEEFIREFNAGNIPVLLAHPASAGHGLNLQESAGHVIFFGPTWNLEHYDQAIARVHRQGNPNAHVTVHTIVAKDTKDNEVAEVLRAKDRTQRDLLAAMKRKVRT